MSLKSIQQEMKEKSLAERMAFDEIFQRERLNADEHTAAKIAWNTIKLGGYGKCQIEIKQDQMEEVQEQEEEKETVKNVRKYKPIKREGKTITRTSSENVFKDSE